MAKKTVILKCGSRFIGATADEGPPIVMREGDEVIIQPANPRKMKNRGRRCRITGKIERNGYTDIKVQYLDTMKAGSASPSDLEPVGRE